MKKLVLVMTMAISLLTMVSFSYASWEVDIKNNCKEDVRVEVKGEHLFWRQVDCRVTVPAGGSKTCKMPDGICPDSVKAFDAATNKVLGGSRFMGYPACYNVKAELSTNKGVCSLTKPNYEWYGGSSLH